MTKKISLNTSWGIEKNQVHSIVERTAAWKIWRPTIKAYFTGRCRVFCYFTRLSNRYKNVWCMTIVFILFSVVAEKSQISIGWQFRGRSEEWVIGGTASVQTFGRPVFSKQKPEQRDRVSWHWKSLDGMQFWTYTHNSLVVHRAMIIISNLARLLRREDI